MNIKKVKHGIRIKIWNLLEEKRVGRFPLPLKGRIPNFAQAEKAGELLTGVEEWKRAKVLKINPDAPQRKVRELALKEGKCVIMPTPRLKHGFLLLKGLKDKSKEASTISGASKYGKLAELKGLPKIDLIVNGSVTVTSEGARLGKGHGYGEIEYAICRELGLVDDKTPVVTTVHELQVIEWIPLEEHDVSVDIIVTPERVIRTNTKYPKPHGIFWELVTDKMLEEMPILKALRDN